MAFWLKKGHSNPNHSLRGFRKDDCLYAPAWAVAGGNGLTQRIARLFERTADLITLLRGTVPILTLGRGALGWRLISGFGGGVIVWLTALGGEALAEQSETGEPPVISTHPGSITARLGSDVFFSVGAEGSSPLAFQWMKNGIPIVGAITPRLILNNIQISDAATYHVVVGNAFGKASSAGVVLIIQTPLVITRSPSDQVAKAGSDVSFTVNATSKSPISYRWLRNEVLIAGATTNVLVLRNVQESDAGAYVAVVYSDDDGIRTRPAFLSIIGAVTPQITVQPTNQTVLLGTRVVFSVQAAGGIPFGFQWSKDGRALTNGNASNFTISSATEGDAGNYSVVVTNQGGSVASVAARLVVTVPPVFLTQPTNRVVLSGTNVSFAADATGVPPPAFQWFKDGVRIVGGLNPLLVLANVQAASVGSYYVVATNSVGAATSLLATLTVRVPAKLKSQPLSQEVIPGQPATLSTEAEGDPPLMFQWYRTNSAIVGATNSVLRLTNFVRSDAGSYRVSVSNAWASVVSAEAILGVKIPVQITAQPLDQSIFVGSNATFVVRATSLSALTYQWFKNGKLYANTASSDLTLSRVGYSDAGSYFAVLSSLYGTETSSVARLTVNGPPVIERQPVDLTVVAGSNTGFVPRVNGTLPLSVLWFKSGVTVANATNLVLQVQNARFSDQADYRFVVTNVFGSATSLIARLTVNAPPTIRAQPLGQTTLAGAVMRFAVSADGSPPLRYQWFKNDAIVAGGTNWILELADLQVSDGGLYRVVVRNEYGVAASTSAMLTVGYAASILYQPMSQSANVGAPVSFGVAAEGTLPLTFKWYKDGAIISGATNSVLAIPSVRTADAGKYTVAVSNSFGQATSAEASLDVRAPLAIKGDFNRDGLPDIVFQNRAGELATWFMTGAEMISAGFLTPSSPSQPGWSLAGSADFDHDGSDDLIFQHIDGVVAVWLMRGSSLLTASLMDVALLRSEDWRIVGIGAFDRYQRIDLVVRAGNGRLGVAVLDRLGISSITLLNLGNPIDSDWMVAGTGDFNEDGKVDLVFQHRDGTLAVWYLDGTTTSSAAVFNPSHPGDSLWRVVGITDRNGDGRPDLLFQHAVEGTLAVWFMDGVRLSGARLLNPSSPGGTWRVVAP